MRLSPIAIFTAAMLLGAQASADVTIFTDDIALQQNKSEKQFFSQSGLSPEQAEVVPGAGDRMALSLVSKIVIPDSWKIESSGNFDNSVVSWSGGTSWPQVLREIAQREQIFISLDWIKKVASIHVPGERAQLAQSNVNAAQEAQEAQKAFQVRSDMEKSEKRDRVESRANNTESQLELLMARSKDAQNSNQELIESLTQRSQQAESDRQALKRMLDEERLKRAQLEEKYKVIDPSVGDGNAGKDATELFAEHQARWVLPFDASFSYFLKGGFSDYLTLDTPATYIAKEGSIEEVLTQWCVQIGCFVDYRAGVQHYNPYQVDIKGSYKEAALALVSVFEKSQRPLKIDVFPAVKHQGKQGLVVVSDLNFEKSQ